MKKAIGLLQIFGGLWGFIVFMISIISGNFKMLIGLPFFALSIIAGFLLLTDKKIGKVLSIINLILQLIKIRAFDIIFYYYSGLGVYLNFGSGSFGANTKIGGGLMFGLVNTHANFLSINILSLILIVLLIRDKKITTPA